MAKSKELLLKLQRTNCFITLESLWIP